MGRNPHFMNDTRAGSLASGSGSGRSGGQHTGNEKQEARDLKKEVADFFEIVFVGLGAANVRMSAVKTMTGEGRQKAEDEKLQTQEGGLNQLCDFGTPSPGNL